MLDFIMMYVCEYFEFDIGWDEFKNKCLGYTYSISSEEVIGALHSYPVIPGLVIDPASISPNTQSYETTPCCLFLLISTQPIADACSI